MTPCEVSPAEAFLVVKSGPTACADAAASGCADLRDLAGAKSTFGSLSAWSFIGAGVLGAATIVYVFVLPQPAPKAAVRIAPLLTAGERGLVVGGTF